MKAVFLDRDGTISVGEPHYARIDSIDKLELLPTVMDALHLLSNLDYGIFIVTNQAGIAEGLISETEFERINQRLLDMIAPSGIRILKSYHCPHSKDVGCKCQKPKPGMLLAASKEFDIALQASWMIGDRMTDVATGINAGTKSILVQSGAAQINTGVADYIADNLLDAIAYIAKQQ
jgi:D-glycero-D-manno-heptose 1,7-bisphosphate phosphatase